MKRKIKKHLMNLEHNIATNHKYFITRVLIGSNTTGLITRLR